MLGSFIKKEAAETLLGPKFLITFSISLALIVISVLSGYSLYEEEMRWHANANLQNRERLANLGSYGYLKDSGTKTLREPQKLSIFVRGVDSAIGRAAIVSDDTNIVLRDSRVGLNPIFAVFGELDLAFIVKFVLSLFALLFSYNCISGERESGTLKQVFSNSISRSTFILGKGIGGLVPLFLTFLLPFLLSLLLLITLFDTNLSGDEWLRLALISLVSILYLAVFYMIGMFMSAISRNSMVSFLLCLFVWVLSIAVLPKVAVEVSEQISPMPSIDEVEAKRTILRRSYFKTLQERLQKEIYDAIVSGADRDTVRDLRARIDNECREKIAAEEKKILDDYRLHQDRLIQTAESISRISPTSCYTFAIGNLAGTDVNLMHRYMESLIRYRNEFLNYADQKLETFKNDSSMTVTGISTSISVNSDREGENRSVDVSVQTPSQLIDVGDMPSFKMENMTFYSALEKFQLEVLILSITAILFFIGTFVTFIRYDVR